MDSKHLVIKIMSIQTLLQCKLDKRYCKYFFNVLVPSKNRSWFPDHDLHIFWNTLKTEFESKVFDQFLPWYIAKELTKMANYISMAAIISEKDVSMIRREGYRGKEKKILNPQTIWIGMSSTTRLSHPSY